METIPKAKWSFRVSMVKKNEKLNRPKSRQTPQTASSSKKRQSTTSRHSEWPNLVEGEKIPYSPRLMLLNDASQIGKGNFNNPTRQFQSTTERAKSYSALSRAPTKNTEFATPNITASHSSPNLQPDYYNQQQKLIYTSKLREVSANLLKSRADSLKTGARQQKYQQQRDNTEYPNIVNLLNDQYESKDLGARNKSVVRFADVTRSNNALNISPKNHDIEIEPPQRLGDNPRPESSQKRDTMTFRTSNTKPHVSGYWRQ